MVDFAYAQAQPKEVDPPTNREGGLGCCRRGQAPEHFTSSHYR
jgi:hypothetical protein